MTAKARHIARECAPVNELEDGMQAREAKRQRKMAKDNRMVCGARRRRDGQPCQALSVPGKRRCKWHGGCSTGPRTAEGKARVAENKPHKNNAASVLNTTGKLTRNQKSCKVIFPKNPSYYAIVIEKR